MRVPGAKIPVPLGFIPPCLPTPCQSPPKGSAWVHEIKHDGYRLIARRDGNRVRLFTRRGYDWSGKYPWIVESLLSLRVRSVIVDGEAVWAGKDGKSDFDRLHSHAHDDQVFLYAFDLLELNGEDYRQHPLDKRKAKLKKQGMRFSEQHRWRWRDDIQARLSFALALPMCRSRDVILLFTVPTQTLSARWRESHKRNL